MDVNKEKRRARIYDPVRKRYVEATPEEQVRQFVIRFLYRECGIPLGHISVEASMQLYGRQFRTDIQVRDRKGKSVLVVECKRPSVPLDDTVLAQAMKYHLKEEEKFIVITNGREFRSYMGENRGGARIWSELDRFPDWEMLSGSDQKNASGYAQGTNNAR